MPRLLTETIGVGDKSWLGSTHGLRNGVSAVLDVTTLVSADYPNGYLPSGFPLGQITATEKVGAYSGDSTDEVQTLTVGGSGLTSFTLTFGGQTTTSLVAAATAAQVQAALEALSTIGTGNVAVTGSAGGPWTVTFQGALANQNVAQLTTTPTGGSGTVTAATTTAGGADATSDGREILFGFLLNDTPIRSGDTSLNVAVLRHGIIKVAKLPIPFAATGHNTTGQFTFSTLGGGA